MSFLYRIFHLFLCFCKNILWQNFSDSETMTNTRKVIWSSTQVEMIWKSIIAPGRFNASPIICLLNYIVILNKSFLFFLWEFITILINKEPGLKKSIAIKMVNTFLSIVVSLDLLWDLPQDLSEPVLDASFHIFSFCRVWKL